MIALSIETPTAASPEPDKQAKKKRIQLILIPLSIAFGLLLGVVYVGGRIVTARAQAQQKVQVAKTAPKPAPAPVPVVAPTPKPPVEETLSKPSAMATPQAVAAALKPTAPAPKPVRHVYSEPATLTLITPIPGETYLQLAALPPSLAIRYVDSLKDYDVDARIAPGPAPDSLRILLGPFNKLDSLHETQKKLEASHIESFIRYY